MSVTEPHAVIKKQEKAAPLFTGPSTECGSVFDLAEFYTGGIS